jgi:hypothetical protein
MKRRGGSGERRRGIGGEGRGGKGRRERREDGVMNEGV